MSITAYDIEICNAAFAKIGARPITSFTDGTVESDAASALYEITFDELLASHPWKFALKSAGLGIYDNPVPQITPTPLLEGDVVWALPNDYLRLVSVIDALRKVAVNYKVVGDYIHATSGSLHAYYIGTVSAQNLPSFFKALLINKLAAEFCLPVTESSSRADSLLKLFEKQFNKARTLDDRSDSPQRFDSFSLIDARG